jgi:hypothetical protein
MPFSCMASIASAFWRAVGSGGGGAAAFVVSTAGDAATALPSEQATRLTTAGRATAAVAPWRKKSRREVGLDDAERSDTKASRLG